MSKHKLSSKEFIELNKSAIYKIYSNLYNQKEDYRKIIEVRNKEAVSELHKIYSNLYNQKEDYQKDVKVRNKGAVSDPDATIFKPMHFKTVREILVSSVPEECKNLIVDSSITSRIKTETLPNNTIVHSYRGSTTDEKIRVLNRYLEQKIKCVTLQDGTNCILEQKIASPDETINKFLELIEVSIAQYSPDMVAICKKPPIINNHEAKVDIDELINAINENFGSRADFEVLN